MTKGSVIAVAAASALALPPVSAAALAVRLALVPAHPRIGQTIALVVRTYAPFKAEGRPCGFRLEPWRVRYPFRVQAVNPEGSILRVRVHQGRSNRYVGHLRPRVAGRWTIRVTNFGPRYNRCSGGLLRFRVRR